MKNKMLLLTVAAILFMIGIAILIAVAVTNNGDDIPDGIYYGSDITTEEIDEPEADTETAFLTEHDWIRNVDDTEHISFHRDGSFSYWCSCGSAVDDYDLYDSFEYKDSVLTVKGGDDSALINVIYYDGYYLCLYLEQQQECRVFVDSDYADSPYVEHDPHGFVSDNWVELHILGYDGIALKAAPLNYDGDAKKDFEEYIKELKVTDDIEFYCVTTVDDKGEVTTEHFKLEAEDMEYIGEYYTGGYAQLDAEGNIRYMVFYGKTIIQ